MVLCFVGVVLRFVGMVLRFVGVVLCFVGVVGFLPRNLGCSDVYERSEEEGRDGEGGEGGLKNVTIGNPPSLSSFLGAASFGHKVHHSVAWRPGCEGPQHEGDDGSIQCHGSLKTSEYM